MRISRRSNTSDNKRAATRDNWISNLISGLVSPGWQVYRRKIHRDVFEIVSSEKSVPRFDSVEWSRDGGDKKDVRDACDEMCVCKTVFPRQVVARYIASPRVNQSGWITIRANTSGVFSTPGESSLPVPVCARISLIRDGIYYRSPARSPWKLDPRCRSDPILRYRVILIWIFFPSSPRKFIDLDQDETRRLCSILYLAGRKKKEIGKREGWKNIRVVKIITREG